MAVESKLKSPELDALFSLILTLETVEECYLFFEDICTVNEIRAIGQRLAAAKMLRAGVTYQEIAQTLGASTATISRVNRALGYGTGGYQLLLDRETAAEQKKE